MTDEKLAECSASATGIYIRLMCLMHKSEHYGKILLKQKDKQKIKQSTQQSIKQVDLFASKVAKFLPYDLHEVRNALEELIEEGVLQIDGDFLCQKRMVKDGNISDLRAKSGLKGGQKSSQKRKKFASDFAVAKSQANSEYEYDNENEDENDNKKGVQGEKKKFRPPTREMIIDRILSNHPNVGSVVAAEAYADQFHDHYTSNGWKVGKNPMKDWHASLRLWISRNNEFKQQKNGNTTATEERVGRMAKSDLEQYLKRPIQTINFGNTGS